MHLAVPCKQTPNLQETVAATNDGDWGNSVTEQEETATAVTMTWVFVVVEFFD